MNYLFYFGHPAQYLFLRAAIKRLQENNQNRIVLTIKSKDVLEDLLIGDGFSYINLQKEERAKNKISIAVSLLLRLKRIIKIAYQTKASLLIGTDATIAIAGFLLNKTRITIIEDDYAVVKNLARIAYPFTNYILCPDVCDVGKWDKKKIGYAGFMKLAYLHPEQFQADKTIIELYQLKTPYVLIRLSKLGAHHDFGINGINDEFIEVIINKLESKGINIVISTERKVSEKWSPYLLNINPSHIHSLLNESHFLISDSQSMSVEAAMLGVPSIRVSDFANRISVLNVLEFNYELTYSAKPIEKDKILEILEKIINTENTKTVYLERRNKMLNEKINVTNFIVWLLEKPEIRLDLVKKEPNLQQTFISCK